MSELSEFVEALRDYDRRDTDDLMDKAANEIERLEAENQKLRKQRDEARRLLTHYVHVRNSHPQVAGEVWRELCQTIDEWEEVSDE